MRLDGLKNDLPETPNFIHNIIQEEVTRQTKTTNIIPMKAPNKLKWKIGRVAAVALIGIMGTSVAAYAGTKLYYMYLEHRGQYSVATGINVDEVLRRYSFLKKSMISKFQPDIFLTAWNGWMTTS